MNNIDIGNAIKILREDSGYSQKDFSTLTYISPATLSRIEKGNKNMSLDELMTICSALNITINSFLEVVPLLNEKESNQQKFNKISLHHNKYKNSNLNLIKDDLIFFSKLMNEFEESNLLSEIMSIQWYLQLPILFPNYFKPINKTLINTQATRILKKNILVYSDLVFLATVVIILDKEIMDNQVINKLPFISTRYFNKKEFRLLEMMYENISDYYLRNYTIENAEDTEKKLNLIFDIWLDYIKKYAPFENNLIYQHNYAMYEILYKKRPKKNIIEYLDYHHKCLTEIGFSQLSKVLKDETTDYLNNIHGNLNVNILN